MLDHIRATLEKYNLPNKGGYKRISDLLKDKQITYQQLKRIKNYFDNIPKEDGEIEYNLNGGEPMKNFVNDLLTKERDLVKKNKEAKDVAGVQNSYRKEHDKNDLNINTNNNITTESIKKLVKESLDQLKKASLGVVFNKEGKLLILQRREEDEWMPNKWALVGGKIEEGESAEEAILREIKEEIGISDNNLKIKIKSEIFNIEDNVLQFLFLILSETSKINLNQEHQNFKWVDFSELDEYDSVPNLKKYVKTVIEQDK